MPKNSYIYISFMHYFVNHFCTKISRLFFCDMTIEFTNKQKSNQVYVQFSAAEERRNELMCNY